MNKNKLDVLFDQKNIERFIYILFPFLMVVTGIYEGYTIRPDSASYVDAEVIRSPFYPFFINSIRSFASENYLSVVVIVQGTLLLICFVFFMETLAQIFPLKPILKICLALAISFLNIFFYSSYILTESITFSIYLLFLVYLLRYLFQEQNWRFLCYALILTTLLVVTRKQLYFMYPVWGALALFICIQSRSFKKGIIILLGVLCSLIAAQVIERSHVYHKSGNFIQLPLAGIQWITSSIFLSTPEDMKLLEGKAERQFFIELYTILDQAGALIKRPSEEEAAAIKMQSVITDTDREKIAMHLRYVMDYSTRYGLYSELYDHYRIKHVMPPFSGESLESVKWEMPAHEHRYVWQENLARTEIHKSNYVPILAFLLFEVMHSLDYIECSQMMVCTTQDWFIVDQYTTSLASYLIFADLSKHVVVYWESIMSYYGVWATVGFILLFCYSAIRSCIKNEKIWIFIAMSLSCVLSNIFLVGILQTPISRYIIYTDTLLVIACVLMISTLLNRKIPAK